MAANIKIIFFVFLGVAACLFSIILNQYFNEKQKINLLVEHQINNVVDQIAELRYLEQDFIQNANDSNWAQLNEDMNSILDDLNKTVSINKNYQSEIEDLSNEIREYQSVMNRLYKPVIELKERKKELQEIGLSFSIIIEEKILKQYEKEEGLKLFIGESIDPFKTRMKDEAHKLLALHLKQQVILYELILNMDIEEYKYKKNKISKALNHHESQLNYMSVLIGTESSMQATLRSLKQKLRILIAHENAIVKLYTEIIEINDQLIDIDRILSNKSIDLSKKINSLREQSNKNIRLLNSFILIVILTSLSILGLLLAIDIIRLIRKLRFAKLKQDESEKKYRNIIEQAGDSVVLLDFNGNIIEANEHACSSLGYTYDKFVSLHISDVDKSVLLKNHKIEFWDKLIPGKPITLESTHTRKDGTSFPVEVRLGLSKINGVDYVLGLARDITERKNFENKIRKINSELEDRIKERTSQLEESNKDLELFAYSISHDLRAPLRAINGFSKILVEEYIDQLDSDAQHYLQRIIKGSEWMGAMIDDILELSRANRKKIEVQEVNLSKLVEEAVISLQNNDPDRKVEFDIQKDQIVKGDLYLLNSMLENLLTNAWKFTKYVDIAKISFGFIMKDKEKFYFIKDNGVGFNMEYYDKLFTPFQRFHSEKKFSGTGIGLASVKQTIKRHNGKVWAESEGEGKGAAFYFSINIIEGDENG